MQIFLFAALATFTLISSLVGQTVKPPLPSHDRTSTNMARVPSAELYGAGVKTLNALNKFYLATTFAETAIDSDDRLLSLMRNLLDENKALDRGCEMIKPLALQHNSAIRIAGEGSCTGARKIIQSNNRLLRKLKRSGTVNGNEWRYAFAEAGSEREDGYQLIARAAPFVTVAMFSPNENGQKYGPIPYLITAEQRRSLLELIKRDFGQQIEKDISSQEGHNWIVVAARLFRRNIMYDTAEEENAGEAKFMRIK